MACRQTYGSITFPSSIVALNFLPELFHMNDCRINNANENDPNKIHGKFIYSLLKLKARCLGEHRDLIYAMEEVYNCEIDSASSFFSNLSDQIDPLLVYFLNEEYSKKRSYKECLEPIIFNAIKENHQGHDFSLELNLKAARTDTEDVFENRMNFITSSNFLDFTVSSYSVFEKWMGKIYEALRTSEPSSGRKKLHMEKLVQQYGKAKDQEARDKILGKMMGNFSAYVSSSEMIQFVLARTNKEYPRDKDRDRKVIEFYGARRNTIHNLGTHTRKTIQPITIDETTIKLEHLRAAFTTDFNTLIDHCDELFHIYCEVMINLKLTEMILFLELDDETQEEPK